MFGVEFCVGIRFCVSNKVFAFGIRFGVSNKVVRWDRVLRWSKTFRLDWRRSKSWYQEWQKSVHIRPMVSLVCG